MDLTSPTFQHNDVIPAVHTCEGENEAPLLLINNIPTDTQSLTLIMNDPDAPNGSWEHWMMYNIEPTGTTTEITPTTPHTPVKNSFGTEEYGGPCPPPGPAHRYVFTVYALDVQLQENITSKDALQNAMKDHIIAETVLVGLYQK